MITAILPTLLLSWSLTFNGPGVTQHGYIQPGGYQLMKHRIGKQAVIHPIEYGLTLKTESMQYSINYLKDCYGHHAGSALFGPKIDFLGYFSLGGVLGGYIRESMTSGDMPFIWKTHGLDILPMAGATLSFRAPINKVLSVEVNTMSNFFITHSNAGLRLDF